jgi:hypothetical protein
MPVIATCLSTFYEFEVLYALMQAAVGGTAADDADPFNDPFFNDPSQGVAVDSEEEEEGGRGDRLASGRRGATREGDGGGGGGGAGSKHKAASKGSKAGEATKSAAELELLVMDDDVLR